MEQIRDGMTGKIIWPRPARVVPRTRTRQFAVKRWYHRWAEAILQAWRRAVAFTKWLMRMTAIAGVVVGLMGIAVAWTKWDDGRTMTAFAATVASTTVQIVQPGFPPILQKICQAESHLHQTCTEDLVKVGMCPKSDLGSPLIRPVTSGDYTGTYDMGYCQINSMHLAEARAMGLDVLNSEKDNKDFALHLFYTQGTKPWDPSRKYWDK